MDVLERKWILPELSTSLMTGCTHMEWTRTELGVLETIAKEFGLEMTKAHAISQYFGLTTAVPVEDRFSQLYGSALESSRRKQLSEATASIVWSDSLLQSFAHLNGVDLNEEFWRAKAIVLAVLGHPYFARSEPKKEGRQKVSERQKETNLIEWILQADRLRSVLQVTRGKEISDQELALEMARRVLELPANEEEQSERQADKLITKSLTFTRQLTENGLAFSKLLRRHNFKLPSTRANYRVSGDRPSTQDVEKWRPSKAETDTPEWANRFHKNRAERITRAKLPNSR